MKTTTKTEQLLEFAQELKQAGFQVYIPTVPTTYCHFVKNNKIGYVEVGDWGFNFGTVHKPNSQCGTGFSIIREVHNPNVSMAEDSLVFAPIWASGDCLKAIVKYKNWEDYINSPMNKWQQYRAL